MSTTHFPAAPPLPQVRCLFPRNENQLRAVQGLAQGHRAGISGRGGLTAEHSASCSPWAKNRPGPPWALAIPGLGPGRRGPGSQECSLSLIHFMWPFQGVLTGPQEGSLEGHSFLLHRGLCPWHSIRGQHLLRETKHLPSTCHQTVTLCLCQGILPAGSARHCGASQGLLSHCPLQGRSLPEHLLTGKA